MTPVQLPYVMAFLPCDMIWQDPGTSKLYILGAFRQIQADGFPLHHAGFHVFVALSDGRGRNRMKVRLVSMDEEDIIFQRDFDADFDDPLEVMEFSVSSRELVIPVPQPYRLQLLANGELLMERRITVLGNDDGTEHETTT